MFRCTVWHLFIQLDLIVSENSQFTFLTMCDISTQCMTIDESQPVQQLQTITDNIITSEYIPQHLLYCQTHLAANHFEAPSNHELVCFKLHSYATCLIFIPLNLPADFFYRRLLRFTPHQCFKHSQLFVVFRTVGSTVAPRQQTCIFFSCRTTT